jgi:hypothetical protein
MYLAVFMMGSPALKLNTRCPASFFCCAIVLMVTVADGGIWTFDENMDGAE